METVGKVYVVVGGAPERNKTHVKDVCIGTVVTSSILLLDSVNSVFFSV